ncbi:hypothetical protein [Marinobacter sp. F4216]|nr:hypothetical protein [Marinobacter sp. F4216]MBZ2168106.1 hypothetical protein [Marinobacter sp. F4216]
MAKDRQAFSVITEVDFQEDMVLALANASGMLARDRQGLKQEADSVVK